MTIRRAASWTATYAAWLLSCGLGVVIQLLLRQTLRIAADLAGAGQLAVTVIDRFVLLFAAIALIAVIVFTEHYLREGLRKKRIGERVAGVFGIELLTVFVLHSFITTAVGMGVQPVQWALLAGEAVGGTALVVYRRQLRRKRLARRTR